MNKAAYWILGILGFVGLTIGVVFLLNSTGVIDLNSATAALSSTDPSSIATSAGGR